MSTFRVSKKTFILVILNLKEYIKYIFFNWNIIDESWHGILGTGGIQADWGVWEKEI